MTGLGHYCCCSRVHPLWTATVGQPHNNIIICRVQLGQATSQLCQRTGIVDVRHSLAALQSHLNNHKPYLPATVF